MGANVFRATLAVFLGCTTGTQAFAYLMHLEDGRLGLPLWREGWLAYYGPWQIVEWAWLWGGQAPLPLPCLGSSAWQVSS